MKNIVSCDIALKLKEKLFNLECLYHYTTNGALRPNYVHPVGGEYTSEGAWGCCNTLFSDKTCDAPSISQVLEWLREKYWLHIEIYYVDHGGNPYKFVIKQTCIYAEWTNDEFYESYEAAAMGAILFIIDNLI